jgi:hypothetical protein
VFVSTGWHPLRLSSYMLWPAPPIGSGQSGHRRRSHKTSSPYHVYLRYSIAVIRQQSWIQKAPHVDALLDESRYQGGGVAGAAGTMIESKVPRLISATEATGPLDSASLHAIRSVDILFMIY